MRSSGNSKKIVTKTRNNGDNSRNFNSIFLIISLLIVVILVVFSSLQYYLPLFYCSNLKNNYNSKKIAEARSLPDGSVEYSFIIISDLDHNNKVSDKKNTWQSFIYQGKITVDANRINAQVNWDQNIQSLQSQISAGGRAMELSDLTYYNGKILSIDDRTGIIYEIVDFKHAIPWVFLNDGFGNTTKGFKGEWMTVKDDNLYVGGTGKEWTTTDGIFINFNPMYIKIVNHNGMVQHISWIDEYKKLRKSEDIEFPGYMIFESVQWSDIHKKWFFLPRRASKERYLEKKDEFSGTNLLLIADENFENIKVKRIGELKDSLLGFSAFQFLPNSNDKFIAALKTKEKNGMAVASYITVFNVETSHILLHDEIIPNGAFKYEGILFLNNSY